MGMLSPASLVVMKIKSATSLLTGAWFFLPTVLPFLLLLRWDMTVVGQMLMGPLYLAKNRLVEDYPG